MLPDWIVLVAFSLGAVPLFIYAGRVLTRGARTRNEYERAIVFVCLGCTLVVMVSVKGLKLGHLTDSLLSRTSMDRAEIGTTLALLMTSWIIGLVATGRWRRRQAITEDYDDRADGNAVAADRKSEDEIGGGLEGPEW